MGLLKEFREFAVRGNVIDMAVGIIIGAAFTGVVNSLVNDVVMPPIGAVLSQVDFSSLAVTIVSEEPGAAPDQKAAAPAAPPPAPAAAPKRPAVKLAYGKFINAVISFLITAFVVFLLVKQINRLKRAAPEGPPQTKECAYCASAIPLKASRCPNCTSQLQPT